MNLGNCGSLRVRPLTDTWYRAIQPQHQQTALQRHHTRRFPSRFNEGQNLFDILYLAEDQMVALFEVQALLGSPFQTWVPNPYQAWIVLNVNVTLQAVADLTQVTEQHVVDMTIQELTGDWRGYQLRLHVLSRIQPAGLPAPTQRRGYRFIAPVTLVEPPAPLAPPTELDPPEIGTPPPLAAEWRQLTVLFCDLVDSTRLAEHLDPEDLREVLQAYHQTCAVVVERYDGYVAQYLGDGVLVYFGYPVAHEDAACWAIHAGLGLIDAVADLNARLDRDRGIHLAVRIGIHTGLVVVDWGHEGKRTERLAIGATPNLAAHLQGLAAPNTVSREPSRALILIASSPVRSSWRLSRGSATSPVLCKSTRRQA